MKKGLRLFETKKTKPIDSLMERYKYFRSLLGHNHRALSLIAGMEQLYFSGRPFTLNQIRITYEELLESITGLAYCLESMTGERFPELIRRIEEIDEKLFASFSPSCLLPSKTLTISMQDIEANMQKLVGSKALNLAMLRNQLGLKTPSGFVITSYAFNRFLEHNNLNRTIENGLSTLSVDDYEAIERESKSIRSKILEGEMPEDIEYAIFKGFEELQRHSNDEVMVAVRSSAVGEDTEATFAGQYDSVLNVPKDRLIEAYKEVIASKYSARSINYRLLYGLDDKDTPMAVIILEMVKAKTSGVLYTVDPAIRPHCPLKVTAILGLGEHLVGGSSTPDVFLLDRLEDKVVDSVIASKDFRMVANEGGGVSVNPVEDAIRHKPSLQHNMLMRLRQVGLMIEEYFESPQDIEWAIDDKEDLFLLQTRLLNVPKMHPEDPLEHRDVVSARPVITGGETASSGVCTGQVVHYNDITTIMDNREDIVLIAKNATPELARFIGKVKGIVTEFGSASSHLASVAREFGVPAVFGMKGALSILTQGQYITLWADKAMVYEGIIEELLQNMSPSRKVIYNSAVHKRMRDVLDLISPLNMTDPNSPEFIPSKAQTFHDIIRYTHEIAVRQMFGIGDIQRSKTYKARLLRTKLPLNIWIVDLSEGGRENKGRDIEYQDIKSVPFMAIWRGFIHPGVNWEGTMSLKTSKISSLFAVAATSELGEQPGGESYAILAEDYMNLSIKFAYHFATVDALCGDKESQNYISLQFSGGAGSYYGKTLRVQLMGAVLSKLGFRVELKGDLIEAVYARYDRESTMDTLDNLGRLLGSCRLLDITISNQDDIEFYCQQFFKGNYDFINVRNYEVMPSFYIKGGLWKIIADEQGRFCMYDGSHNSGGAIRGIANIFNRFLNIQNRIFVESIESRHHFPLAIVKGNYNRDCAINLKLKLLGGKVDKTGGIAFGIGDVENYLALALDAHEGAITFYRVSKGRTAVLERRNKKIDLGLWHNLTVEITGSMARGYLNNILMIQCSIDKPITGYCGLWAKGDSVILFERIIIKTHVEEVSVDI